MTISALDTSSSSSSSSHRWLGFGNDSISLPAAEAHHGDRAVFLSYRSLHRLLGGEGGGGRVVNSRVVSIALDGGGGGGQDAILDSRAMQEKEEEVASPPLRIKLHRLRRRSSSACAAWDESSLGWATSGCIRVLEDVTYTECECNRGSGGTFALVFDGVDDSFFGGFGGGDSSAVSVTASDDDDDESDGGGGGFSVELAVFLAVIVVIIALAVVAVQVRRVTFFCYALFPIFLSLSFWQVFFC